MDIEYGDSVRFSHSICYFQLANIHPIYPIISTLSGGTNWPMTDDYCNNLNWRQNFPWYNIHIFYIHFVNTNAQIIHQAANHSNRQLSSANERSTQWYMLPNTRTVMPRACCSLAELSSLPTMSPIRSRRFFNTSLYSTLFTHSTSCGFFTVTFFFLLKKNFKIPPFIVFFQDIFSVWLWNRIISVRLEKVLSHTEKKIFTAKYYRQFFMNNKMKIIKL